MSEENAK